MSLWVLIRKDEERMSYAENYFFFNSISKRKIRLGGKIKSQEIYFVFFFVKMRQKYGF